MWSGTESAYSTTQLFPPRAMKVSQDVPFAAPTSLKPGTEGKPSSGGGGTQPASGGVTAPSTVLKGSATTTAPAETTLPVPPIVTAPNVPVSGTVAPTTPANPAQSGTAQTQSIARLPSPVTMRPVDVSATAGQEFRLDVLALQGHAITEATATVSYDPKLVEFRRVGPGAAAISARATDGQVVLTIRRQGGVDQGETVLAMLFFQAKVKGDATVTLQATAGGEAAPAGPVAQEQVVVHVQ
jgi:hypothetical protein